MGRSGWLSWPRPRLPHRLAILQTPGIKSYGCPSPPSAIAACFQLRAHQHFDLIWGEAVQRSNICKAGVVAQRHFDHFADSSSVEEPWINVRS